MKYVKSTGGHTFLGTNITTKSRNVFENYYYIERVKTIFNTCLMYKYKVPSILIFPNDIILQFSYPKFHIYQMFILEGVIEQH